MRADGRKYEMGRRFAILIGLAATGVMALGAQTGAAASEGVVEYDTKVTIGADEWRKGRRIPRGTVLSGSVQSEVIGTPAGCRDQCRNECKGGRRVIVFKQRPGADRKLGATPSIRVHLLQSGSWRLTPASWVAGSGSTVYAKVTRKVGDGFVCRVDRSRTIVV